MSESSESRRLTQRSGRRTPRKTKVARYRRASLDRKGQATSVRAQANEFERVAPIHGWELDPAADYVDNSVSGSKTNVVRREFERMVREISSGQVRVDYIVVWDISRLTRNRRDKLRIEEIIDKQGVHLYDMRWNIDTSTKHGLFMFAVLSELAIERADELAENQRIAYELRVGDGLAAHQGKNTGLGLRPTYDAAGGFRGNEIIEAEASAIRWAIREIGTGRSTLTSATQAWNDPRSPYHVKPRKAARWDVSTVRQTLCAARNAGCTEVVLERDEHGRPIRTRLVENTDGKMPAIVTKAELLAFRSRLEVNRLRREMHVGVGGRPPKHLCSNHISCPSCGGGLTGLPMPNGVANYRCYRCATLSAAQRKEFGFFLVSMRAPILEELVVGATIERIRSGALAELLNEAVDVAGVSEIAADISDAERDLEEFLQTVETAEKNGERISSAAYTRMVLSKESYIERRRDELRAALQEGQAPELALIPNDIADTIAERWDGLPFDWKRRLIDLCWEDIILLPDRAGGRSPEKRLHFVPRRDAKPKQPRKPRSLEEGPRSLDGLLDG